MARKPGQAKHAREGSGARRMTAQERSVADTTVIPNRYERDGDDASRDFGPLSLEPERRHERLGYRDPEEVSQGPLRLDETNYSVERLTLPEGGYNEYADEVISDHDEEGTPRMHYGPVYGSAWSSPQYADSTQNDLLADLPSGAGDVAHEPDDPHLGFHLTAEDLETSPDGYAAREVDVDGEIEKIPDFARQTARHATRNDEIIREDIYEAIDRRADIDAPDISLHVRNGVATIEGEVTDAMLRHRIEQCVDSVDGVKDVNNRLHLATPQARRPWSDS